MPSASQSRSVSGSSGCTSAATTNLMPFFAGHVKESPRKESSPGATTAIWWPSGCTSGRSPARGRITAASTSGTGRVDANAVAQRSKRSAAEAGTTRDEGGFMATAREPMKRKEYEKAAARAPGRAVRAAGLGQGEGSARGRGLRRARRRRQGRHDQGHHRARQPASLPRGGAARAIRPRDDRSCTCSASSGTSRRPAKS